VDFSAERTKQGRAENQLRSETAAIGRKLLKYLISVAKSNHRLPVFVTACQFSGCLVSFFYNHRASPWPNFLEILKCDPSDTLL
jgi:hypothetical protein